MPPRRLRSRGPVRHFVPLLLLAAVTACACRREDPRLAHASQALDRGEIVRAYDLASEVLRQQPESARAQDLKGLALQAMGKDGAEQAFREAIRIDPSSPAPHDHLGALLYQSGRIDEAIAQWREAVRQDPGYAAAHYNLGSATQARGSLEEAVAHFREALKHSPDLVSARINLGIALMGLGRFPGAERELMEAARLAPENPEAAFNLGSTYVAARKTQEGIRELRRALSLRGDFAEAHERIATAYFYEGKLADAEREFKEAVRLNPDFAEAHFGLGALYSERGEEEQAIVEYERTLASRPDHAAASTNLALLYGRRPQAPRRATNRIAAFEIFRRAILNGDYDAAWATLTPRTRAFYLDDPARFRYAASRGFQAEQARTRLASPTFFLRYLEPPEPNSAPGLPYDPSRMDALRDGPEAEFKVDFRVLSGLPGPDPER